MPRATTKDAKEREERARVVKGAKRRRAGARLYGRDALTYTTKFPVSKSVRYNRSSMPLKQSEAIVLRSYPMREADLLVTLFTRSDGKVRGVARSAMKSKKRFGGALEPLTLVRVDWEERERDALTRIDSCDLRQSH